jgi:hypothetical protein
MDRVTKILSSAGLAVGAIFGLAGSFAPSPSLRGLAWGIDGLGLVMGRARSCRSLTFGVVRIELQRVSSCS